MIKEIWRNAKNNILYNSIPFIVSIFCVIQIVLGLRHIQFTALLPFTIMYFVIFLFLFRHSILLIRTIAIAVKVIFTVDLSIRLGVYSIVKYGSARTGKTLSATIEGLFTSAALFGFLERKYRRMDNLRLFDYYKTDEVFMTRWYEVKRSYEHWCIHQDRIPCLMSNYTIHWNGQVSQDLYREHFEQKMWSPSYCVWIADELGRWIELSESSIDNKPLEICDTICWIGQFYEAHLIATEQRPTNIPIDIRDVVSTYERITSFSIVGKPYLLMNILDKLEEFSFKHDLSPYCFLYIDIARRWCETIGFFKFKFEYQGNITFGTKDEIGTRTQYYFMSMHFKYDSRCYYNSNKAKDMEDKNTANDTLILSADAPFIKSIHKRYEIREEREQIKNEEKSLRMKDLALKQDNLILKRKELEKKLNKFDKE